VSALKIAEIGVEKCDLSFDRLFRYAVPESLSGEAAPGVRALVPFGGANAKRQGFIFSVREAGSEKELAGLKSIVSVIDAKPLLNAELLAAAEFMHERYFCTWFAAAKAAVPGGVCAGTEKVYAAAEGLTEERLSALSPEERAVTDYLIRRKTAVRRTFLRRKFSLSPGDPLLLRLARRGILTEDADVFAGTGELSVSRVALAREYEPEDFTEKQNEVLSLLTEAGPMSAAELCYYTGVSASVVQALLKKGVCRTEEEVVPRAPQTEFAAGAYVRPTLSDEQRAAFDVLWDAYRRKEKKTALLFGVTGSGKTNVYLELIDRVLEDGRNVIVLVPEISLTPQTFSLFRARYGSRIAVLHSGLSMGERRDEWQRIRDGEVRVAIGTRSAVFAPLENIGLVIVDEEQEHTYKSENAPRYNAKEVARFRCAYHGALLVLASATPLVEDYARAMNGSYLLAELTDRYGEAQLPEVLTVDMTDKTLLERYLSLSRPLTDAIGQNLAAGEQTILLVNRRGYNTFVVCAECKKVLSCPRCSISLTYHAANNRLMCHYCGYSAPYEDTCPDCGAQNIRYAGCGTQKVEQELKLRFPGARVLRMDADTTAARNAHDRMLSAFGRGEYDILLGTQMVAKGLDFPGVTLVGVASADRELYNDDFRCTERTFDLITQVVGRAGRGGRKGRAVIQTVTPDNDVLAAAAAQDYKKYYATEILLRKAMIYPPFCDICVVGFSGPDKERVAECAAAFLEALRARSEGEYGDVKTVVLGPLAPKVSKVNNRYRQRIIIKSKNTARFRRFIRETMDAVYADRKHQKVTVFADVNPETMN
jgi:primosomal protein N' (replication factor Y)